MSGSTGRRRRLTFLTGASGSGKSTLAARLRAGDVCCDAQFFEFDGIGVPPVAEMVATFGSPAGWQRWATTRWVARLARDELTHRPCVLDGQSRLSFIHAACRAEGVTDYRIVLLDCDDQVRADRLVGRGQAELVTEEMITWASFLRAEARDDDRADVLDTSSTTVAEAARQLVHLLDARVPSVAAAPVQLSDQWAR